MSGEFWQWAENINEDALLNFTPTIFKMSFALKKLPKIF